MKRGKEMVDEASLGDGINGMELEFLEGSSASVDRQLGCRGQMSGCFAEEGRERQKGVCGDWRVRCGMLV